MSASAAAATEAPSAAGRSHVSLETRVAVLGIVGALTGALVGGLVTWLVTSAQIDSQRQAAQRAELVQLYTSFVVAEAKFLVQAASSLAEGKHLSVPKLTPTFTQFLADDEEIGLVAPVAVATAAHHLEQGLSTIMDRVSAGTISPGWFHRIVNQERAPARAFRGLARSSIQGA